MKQITVYLVVFLCLFKLILGWKAILERLDVVYVNEKIAKVNYARAHKYNRTTTAISSDFDLLVDLQTDVMIEIKIHGFLSNQYRELPIVIKRNICEFVKMEYQWVKGEIVGHFLECPLLKGNYNLKNFTFNVSHFPKKPWSINKYMLLFRLYNKEKICLFKLFVTTTDDDEYSV